MKKEDQQLEALNDIRRMMKESSKFLSLSGLSGVFAGLYALAGAYVGHALLKSHTYSTYSSRHEEAPVPGNLELKIILICMVVLLLSILTALALSLRKAKRSGQRLFDHTSKKVFWSMSIPLSAGGLFCLALLYHQLTMMVSPVMLLFYGLALLNSSKYTISEIKYLALLEILLGLTAAFFPGHGLVFWALGFGVLHVIYGVIMWNKYDRHS